MNYMVLLLALLTAFPPLSTDMYLPALPMLGQMWHQPMSVINLTLAGFFVVYCICLLIYGPISDRYGRRPPLMIGIGIYIVSSLACACANGVWMLLAARIFQAAGAASSAALAMAIVKDIYEGRTRERMLAHISIIMGWAPMAAPIVGGWMVAYLSWRWIFVVQAAIGAIALAGILRMPETLRHRSDAGFLPAATAYVRHFRNYRFIVLTLVLSSMSLPIFAFIGGSSDIYIAHYGLSEQQFSYFFCFNAFAFLAGASSFAFFSRWISSSRRVITLGYSGALCAGALLTFGPHGSPWSLALPMWMLCFCVGIARPPASSLILDQVSRDTGSASSLIGFCFLMIGAAGMQLISFGWADKVATIGVLTLITGTLVLSFWLYAQKRWYQPERSMQAKAEGVALAQLEEA